MSIIVINDCPSQVLADLVTEFQAAIADLAGIAAWEVSALAVLRGSYLKGAAGLAVGSTPQDVANAAVNFMIAGKEYTLPVNTVGTAPAAGTVPQNLYGAYRFQVGTNLTVNCVGATLNTTGYASALLALAGLPALPSDHASLGTLTVVCTGVAGFQPGTTAINAGTVTSVYADATTLANSLPAAITQTSTYVAPRD